MRKLGLALTLLALLGLAPALAENTVGPSNLIFCNKVAVLEAGASGMQQVVAPVPGQTVNLCGWNVTNTGANGTVQMWAGTQTTTPCDTSPKKLSPAFNVSSNSPNQDHSTYASNSGNIGQGICANPSATTFSVLIWYSQF